MTTAVQNGRSFSLPTFGCEGCQQRKEQIMAGNWQKDALILLLVAGFALCIWRMEFPGNG